MSGRYRKPKRLHLGKRARRRARGKRMAEIAAAWAEVEVPDEWVAELMRGVPV